VGTWAFAQPHHQPAHRPLPTPLADWNVHTGAAVTAAAAVYGPSFNTPSSSDVLYFVTSASAGTPGLSAAGTDVQAGYPSGVTTSNLFALTDLYSSTGKPRVAWAVTIANGSSSNLVLSVDGSRVYVLSKAGVLYCRTGATGAACGSWTDYTGGNTVDLSAPWLNSAGTALYFGDSRGYLHRVNATTGAMVWKTQLNGSASAIHSSPTEVDGIIYVGNDSGYFYRVVDPGTSAPTVVDSLRLASTNGNAVYSSAAVDVDQKRVFSAANGTVWQFLHDARTTTFSSWSSPVPRTLPGQSQTNVWSSPMLDSDNGYLYLGHNSTLYKLVYPQTTNSIQYNGALQGPVSDATYPHGMPLVWGGSVFIGDGAGRAERFGCNAAAAAPGFKSYTADYGTEVSTPIVLDNATGNINFGYASTTGGGIVQYPQDPYQWTCASGGMCAGAICGGAEFGCSASACVPSCTVAPSTLVCQAVPEHGTATFTCPAGTTIRSVLSASYGMPLNTTCSSPPAPLTEGPCHSDLSVSVTAAQCVGNNSCSFAVENYNPPSSTTTFFGDPCYGTLKHYYGVVVCDPVAGRSYCSEQGVTTTCDPVSGSCSGTCATGYADCDDNLVSDGCEVDLTSDPNNCGACGTACSASHVVGARCRNGVCDSVCAAGYADCNSSIQSDGCEKTLTGSYCTCCATACTTGQQCFGGTCKVAGSPVCATAKDNETFQMACPRGETFASFTFAHYGTPAGSCGAYTAGACDADVTSYLQTQCGGKASCSFYVDGTTMGIPCQTPKWLEVQAVCTTAHKC
jgi:hypothetical protein